MENLENLTVRKAVKTDLDQIKALADAHKAELGFILRPALAKSINNGELFVAVDSKSLVGFIDYHHRKDNQTTLYNIAIAPKYRRLGIGRKLVQALVAEARERNKRHISLKCPEDLTANQFYAALGFQLQEIEPGKQRRLKIWRCLLSP